MINPANAGIGKWPHDARCGYFVRAIVGFRGMRPDPGGASDDSKLTALGCFSPSGKVSSWIADRLAEGDTDVVAWGSTIPLWYRHRVGTV
jgi:hypothetical protein